MSANVQVKPSTINFDQRVPDGSFYFDQIQSGYHLVKATPSEKSWSRGQSYVGDNFILLASEFSAAADRLEYTRQQDYIKFQFRLGGNNTVILDGLGEWTIDQPQLLITAGPEDVTKADWLAGGVRYSHVSLCVKPLFFLII